MILETAVQQEDRLAPRLPVRWEFGVGVCQEAAVCVL